MRIVLSGLLWLCAAIAHASSVAVYTEYAFESDPSITVSTQAFFNTGPITGIGIEQVQIEEFNLIFSNRGYWQSANIVLAAGPPFPEGTLVAMYQDGVFDHFASVNLGGNPSIAISPPSNWLGENITLGKNILIDTPCCSGFSRYHLTSRTGPVAIGGAVVPVPAAVWLFASGLLVLIKISRHN